jgi:fatty acid desaturase
MTTATLPSPDADAPSAETLAAGANLASEGDDLDRNRELLANSHGVRYRDFKRTLTPRYGLAWCHLLGGHLALALTGAGVVAAECRLPAGWAAAAAVAACVVFGYGFAYVNLFFHEAAHFLMAPSRVWNDRLANLFIGVIFGQDIKAYRVIHFDHHRHLGTPEDTERSYFDPLNVRFFLELLTGMRAARVFLGRSRVLQERGRQPNRAVSPLTQPSPPGAGGRGQGEGGRHSLIGPVFFGVLLHAAIVLTAVWHGLSLSAGAWVIGIGVVYPVFGAVRQVLEHRSEHARGDVDYGTVPHGPVSRLFGDGPVASTFGGAGFNRHLLHHWEPQISYTRLRELEDFLLDTELADALRARRTSYWKTFLRLLRY